MSYRLKFMDPAKSH